MECASNHGLCIVNPPLPHAPDHEPLTTNSERRTLCPLLHAPNPELRITNHEPNGHRKLNGVRVRIIFRMISFLEPGGPELTGCMSEGETIDGALVLLR